jgi:hypothetical protein
MSNQYFKLGPGQSIFWDPTQSRVDSQKLVGKQIKPLEENSAVEEAKRFGRIRPVDEKEAKAYYQENGIEFPAEEEAPAEEVAKKPAAKKA